MGWSLSHQVGPSCLRLAESHAQVFVQPPQGFGDTRFAAVIVRGILSSFLPSGKDSKNYVALGAGLGGGLIVLVALAIFAIVATIHYRR